MANLNDGEVSLTLGDKEYVLRPTLAAIKALSRKHGGMRTVLEHISTQNFDGIVSVIKIGASVPDNEDAALERRVFNAGLTNDLLMGPVFTYWRVLQNGGKPVPPLVVPTDDAPPDDAPPTEETEGND